MSSVASLSSCRRIVPGSSCRLASSVTGLQEPTAQRYTTGLCCSACSPLGAAHSLSDTGHRSSALLLALLAAAWLNAPELGFCSAGAVGRGGFSGETKDRLICDHGACSGGTAGREAHRLHPRDKATGAREMVCDFNRETTPALGSFLIFMSSKPRYSYPLNLHELTPAILGRSTVENFFSTV